MTGLAKQGALSHFVAVLMVLSILDIPISRVYRKSDEVPEPDKTQFYFYIVFDVILAAVYFVIIFLIDGIPSYLDKLSFLPKFALGDFASLLTKALVLCILYGIEFYVDWWVVQKLKN